MKISLKSGIEFEPAMLESSIGNLEFNTQPENEKPETKPYIIRDRLQRGL